MKGQATNWEKIFVNHAFDMGLVCRIYKELLRLNSKTRASLVAWWLRICLPMQGTRVLALVQKDPTCHGATKPVHHNY